MEAQFYPDVLALAVNTVPSTTISYSDLNVNNIVWVEATNENIDGTATDVFALYYQETNAIDLTVYWFPRTTGQTVYDFQTGINAWTTNNLFPYVEWIQLNGAFEFPPVVAVLINDDFVTHRKYDSHDNTTTIFVGYRQELIDARFRCRGDQERGYIYYGYYGY